VSELPPRGTGIETGRAGERRRGRPRTEQEREIRHILMTMNEQEWKEHQEQVVSRLKEMGYPEDLVRKVISEFLPREVYGEVRLDHGTLRFYYGSGELDVLEWILGFIVNVAAIYVAVALMEVVSSWHG